MNIKKYILPALLFAGILLQFSSCKDDFLAAPPSGYFPPEELISDAASARRVLNSAYNGLRGDGFYGGNLWILNEVMADHIQDGFGELASGGDLKTHYQRNTDNFLGTTRSLMADGSRAIGRCNNLLKYIDQVTDLSEAEKAQMKLECKFLKSICWFELVRMFGQPYGYTADNSHHGIAMYESADPVATPRSSVGQVYQKVISYLRDAADGLPSRNNNYATSWAAKAYLAKAYFQMNQYDSAYHYSNDVIANSGYSLETNLFTDNIFIRSGVNDTIKATTRFNSGMSNEMIFGLISASEVDQSGGNLMGRLRFNNNSASLYMSPYAFSRLTSLSLDNRGKNWVGTFNAPATTLYYAKKYPNPSDTMMQMTLASVTEMVLIRGECAAELNNTSQAESDINAIRQRANLPVVTPGGSASDLVQRFRLEREIELFMEGNRLQDLKRQGAAPSTSKAPNPNLLIRNAPWNCPGMVCQIPDNELSGNPNYPPNPQGGCR